MLPGNVESALLSNIVYRESFYAFKRLSVSQAFTLNIPLNRTCQSLLQLAKQDRMILVESFASRGRVGVGIGSANGASKKLELNFLLLVS